MEEYPADSVTLSIVDCVVVPPGVGPEVTVNEVWSFKVRVFNNGILNMTNVGVFIEGQNGAQVSIRATGPWGTSVIISPPSLIVNAKDSQDTTTFYFKAPPTTMPAGTPLVRAHIFSWHADLDYILSGQE